MSGWIRGVAQAHVTRRQVLFALCLPVLAVILRVLFADYMPRMTFGLLYPAVFAAAFIGGPWVALASTVLGALSTDLFVLEPHLSLTMRVADVVPTIIFVATGCAFAWGQLAYRDLARRTARVEAEREREQRWAVAIEAGRLACWEWDIPAKQTRRSPRYLEALGHSRQSDPMMHDSDFFERVHPDDREPLQQVLESYLAGATPSYQTEFRMRHRDGHYVWFESRGMITERNERGEPLRAFGCQIDITERHLREEVLAASRRSLTEANEALLEAQRVARLCSWRWDAATDRIDGSPEMYRIFGRDSLPGFTVCDGILFPEATLAELQRGTTEELASGKVYSNTVPALRGDGSRFWAKVVSRAVMDSAGQITGVFGTLQDVTEERNALNEVRLLNLKLADMNDSLALAKDAADQHNDAKSAFLNSVSHELRTPLNAVIGFSGLLLDGAAGAVNAEQRRQLMMIRRAGEHQLSLVSDLLDLTAIEAGKLSLDRGPLSLRSVLEETETMLRPLIGTRNIALQFDLPGRGLIVEADALRLRQVLRNLVGNAIKFTEAGSVRVHVGELGSRMVRIAVEDTGAGIGTERLAKLFKPLTQLATDRTRIYEGTGLGLAICKQLVEQMGGAIGVESTLGLGSTFWFTLPMPQFDITTNDRRAAAT